MKIKIENFRGLRAASIDLAGIALIAGANGAGKSSLAQAVAAVLSGVPVPIADVKKTSAGVLVRTGSAKAYAELEAENGTARVDWPRAVHSTKGEPPFISAVAAGIESIATMTAAERAQALQARLGAFPTLEDVQRVLAAEGVNGKAIAAVWDTICAQGWDAAHAHYKEQGQRRKGAWQQITGEHYGDKKAETWMPDGWDLDLAGASGETLQAVLTDARDSLNAMIGTAAVSDAERERLQAKAATLDQFEKDRAEKAAELEKTEADHKAESGYLADMRKPGDAVQKCPHCSNSLAIQGGKIIAGEPVSDDDAKAYRNQSQVVDRLANWANTLRQRVEHAAAMAQQARAAAAELAELESTKAGASQKQVDQAREAVRVAESRFNAWKRKTEADEAFAQIKKNAVAVDMLAPGGLRQQVLTRDAQAFAVEWINPLADCAGWQPVEIDADMSISYGGRLYAVLSESEKFRVRALLQVAIALREQAAAIVIDAADILDRAGRNGLIRILSNIATPSVVCMTLNTREDVPDLAASGLGSSYWISEGKAEPIHAATASV